MQTESQTPETKAPLPKYGWLILSASVMLTCLGYLYRYHDNNLRAFSQLYFDWEVTERTAEVVVMIMKATLVLAIVCAPFRKLRYLVLPGFASLLFELVCLTCNSGALFPYLYLPNQALRLAPFILLVWRFETKTMIRILKVGIAATFIGHGIKCLASNAEFIDYILAFSRMIHAPIEEKQATMVLHLIGAIDILLGHHVLFFKKERIKWVLWYMAAWGAITAFSRIFYYGVGAWHEVAIRNSHALIVFLLLLIIAKKADKEESEISSEG